MFKRYKPFFKAGSMDMLALKFNIFSWLIVSALQVACLIFLWIAVFKNSVNGMDSIIVDNYTDLKNIDLSHINTVSVTSGASTPSFVVDGVINYLNNTYNK